MKKRTTERVVFLGAGNMAEALVKGLLATGAAAADQLTVTDVRAERVQYMRDAFGVLGMASNREACADAGVVILAVKPQQLRDVLLDVAPVLRDGALVISIAAGWRTASIEQALGRALPVVRVMPNTPALVGAGVSALCGGSEAQERHLALAESLLAAVGATVRVEERDMDAVTAISGSGPAYVFLFMEAMLAAARQHGLSADTARRLVLGTFTGAAKLAEAGGQGPGELRERVTSKGGTTAAALAVFQQRHVSDIVAEAVSAARARSEELSRGG